MIKKEAVIKIITGLNDKDIKKWQDYVYDHPDANFFQSLPAFEFLKSVDDNEPVVILAVENDKIIGSLLAVFIKELSGIKGFFSRRCVVRGGPLVSGNNTRIVERLLQELNKVISSRAIYTQFRNFFEMGSLKETFISSGYVYKEHLNILIDLTKSEEELWADVHSKRRNEIRRAKKEGTYFEVSRDRKDLEPTYNILKEVYQRAKLPFPDREYFDIAYDKLGNENFRIFMALHEGKIIGTMYALCFKDIIYDWYAGAYGEYYRKYPNDLIPWEVFLWGKENNYTKFDFGGAGKPGVPYGVRDYKKKFGGEFVNYGRFEKINSRFLYEMGKLGLKVYQKLKK